MKFEHDRSVNEDHIFYKRFWFEDHPYTKQKFNLKCRLPLCSHKPGGSREEPRKCKIKQNYYNNKGIRVLQKGKGKENKEEEQNGF